MFLKQKDYKTLEEIALRERSPIYKVGEVKDNQKFVIEANDDSCPVDLKLEHLFGKPPKTVLTDNTSKPKFEEITYDAGKFTNYLNDVLQLEAVACKDWFSTCSDPLSLFVCTLAMRNDLSGVDRLAAVHSGGRKVPWYKQPCETSST